MVDLRADHTTELRAWHREHLKGAADATVLWGEGCSEPGAGSDLPR